MTNAIVKSYSEKSGKSVAEVENLWNEAKDAAGKKFKSDSNRYWAYVSGTVKKILGLNESTSFKEYVELSFDNPEAKLQAAPEPSAMLGSGAATVDPEPERSIKSDYATFISCIFAARDKAHELHLATKSYAQHVALNELYDLLVDFADEMAEAFQGKHGLIKISVPSTAAVFDQPCAVIYIQFLTSWLETEGRELIGSDPFIINLFEELIGAVFRVKYKLENLT